MLLPHFIIVGPQRCGTTWIYNYLKSHPYICLPRGVKETFFFDKYFNKGLKWYSWHFNQCNPDALIGEVAPSYFHNALVCKRIKKEIPNCKIICTLRNPIERILSLYLHMRRYGMIKYDFKSALKKEPVLINSSLYYYHLSRWVDAFGKENVKILIFDDLKNDPDKYIYDLLNYLKIPNVPLNSIKKKKFNITDFPRNTFLAKQAQNIGDQLRSKRMYTPINIAKKIGLKRFFFSGGKNNIPEIDYHTKKYLKAIFNPEIEMLENYLGRDFSHWK